LKVQGNETAYRSLVQSKRERDDKIKTLLSKSFGASIIAKDIQEVP